MISQFRRGKIISKYNFIEDTNPNSDHRHFRIFRKKQIRAARMRVPNSGTMYEMHSNQIHAIRKLSD